jgi:carboxyl-terminal processing protease
MNNEKKPLPAHIKLGLQIFGGVILVGLVFLGGVYVGYDNRPAFAKISNLVHPTDNSVTNADFSEFWKAWQIVDQNFPGADKITSQDRVYGAIKGMLASFGDPYTTFFPPAENTQFQSQIAGEFSGIGIEIGEKNGLLTVIAPLKGTPAAAAGIKSGDIITKINTTNTSTLTIDQAVDMIVGKNGTTVILTIARQGVPTLIVDTITRATINLSTVDTETKPGGVFVIHFYTFSANSANLFRLAMDKYLASGDHNLLIDLRGNPGGYLDAAVQIGSEFIPQGKTIVKEIGKTPTDVTVHSSTGPVIFPTSDKLIILADQGSASAAEILSGALSEQGIGVLVGQQTFGKGSVQQVIPLTSDTTMKVTIAHWYTPNGISISQKGLTPKVVIPIDPAAKTDTQLQKAIDLFSNPATFQK